MAQPTTPIVVDASVVAKWYLAERGRGAALRVRDDFVSGVISLAAPALMPFEVMNAVRFAKKSISISQLKSIGKSLISYGIEYHPLAEAYLDLTLDASVKNGITIYDGSYLALADHLGSVLYTADREFLESLRKRDRRYAALVDDYSPVEPGMPSA